jgi:nitroimidazol reductase NimA-like FMN-containing flavoprotein (pyridoxamine 5'-phosphate oxidase superfamily)
MTRPSTDAAANKPPTLSPNEIDDLLSKKLIANLATIDKDGGIHILPMWFLRIGKDICIPTSRKTHKYRNLLSRPCASVMIDISRAGLNLRGVLIRGKVEIVYGEDAQQINHSIHIKYVTPEALNNPYVASYLSEGDDVNVKVQMDHVVSWNLANSDAGKALKIGGWFYSLDS